MHSLKKLRTHISYLRSLTTMDTRSGLSESVSVGRYVYHPTDEELHDSVRGIAITVRIRTTRHLLVASWIVKERVHRLDYTVRVGTSETRGASGNRFRTF